MRTHPFITCRRQRRMHARPVVLLTTLGLISGGCARFGFGPPSYVWQALGSSATDGGVSHAGATEQNRAVAVGPSGRVYVGWVDNSTGNNEVYLRYWNGSAWVGLGGSDAPGGLSVDGYPDGSQPTHLGSVLVDPQGHPYVAWTSNYQGGGDNSILVTHWSGSAWQGLDGSNSGHGIGEGLWPRLALDSSGRPAVDWEADGLGQSGSGRDVFLRRWDPAGGTWVELGGSATGQGVSSNTPNGWDQEIAAGRNGDVFVIWLDASTPASSLYLAKWNGSSWVALGKSLSPGGLSGDTIPTRPWLVASDGVPTVAWNSSAGGHSEIYIERWSGSAWAPLGSSMPLTLGKHGIVDKVEGAEVAMALDPSGNPVLVWSQPDTLGINVYAARFDGGHWDALYDFKTPGGISQTAQDSGWPAVAVAPDGTIYVVWEEQVAPSNTEAYLLRALSP